MKRRKFIQAALVAPAAATATASGASSERLYGTPLSIQADGGQAAAKFMLPLSQTGLPADSWAELARVAARRPCWRGGAQCRRRESVSPCR